ncbi:MAG: hypothetical protein ACE5HA_19540, partial [Anaerolineae bacterium]
SSLLIAPCGDETWQQSSLSELPLIWNAADVIEFGDRHTPRGGQWFAWLGNYHDTDFHLDDVSLELCSPGGEAGYR